MFESRFGWQVCTYACSFWCLACYRVRFQYGSLLGRSFCWFAGFIVEFLLSWDFTFVRCYFLCERHSALTSPPGGNQVDGLPPALCLVRSTLPWWNFLAGQRQHSREVVRSTLTSWKFAGQPDAQFSDPAVHMSFWDTFGGFWIINRHQFEMGLKVSSYFDPFYMPKLKICPLVVAFVLR